MDEGKGSHDGDNIQVWAYNLFYSHLSKSNSKIVNKTSLIACKPNNHKTNWMKNDIKKSEGDDKENFWNYRGIYSFPKISR